MYGAIELIQYKTTIIIIFYSLRNVSVTLQNTQNSHNTLISVIWLRVVGNE